MAHVLSSYPVGVNSAILERMQELSRRKTSFEVDMAKVDVAKRILGTRTLTETVDAALAEVERADRRRRLAQLLFEPGSVQLDDPDVMSGAWR